jgi:hypothetical protein
MISSGRESPRVTAPQRGQRIDLDSREKLERPLVRPDWPALTAFGIVSMFHKKQRGVKVVRMIDQMPIDLGGGAPHRQGLC